jgi:hypothetical protein
MCPWRRTKIKGSKHVGQWKYTINVIKLYMSDIKYKVKMYGMNNIKFTDFLDFDPANKQQKLM